VFDRAADTGCRQWLVRCPKPDEHTAAFRGRWAAVLQVCSYRRSDIGGQRELLDPMAFARHDEFPSAPINIIELQ
jgi:hypothetical protein